MNKLTTEQLLFAHRIGATHFSELLNMYQLDGEFWHHWDEGWYPSDATDSNTQTIAARIDFTPLYDWIDHDGGECPVRKDDMVTIELSTPDGGLLTNKASLFEWSARGVGGVKVFKRFKLHRDEYWPEQRADGGQSGNDGEHYAEATETEHTTAHHKRPDGTDLIDDWWDTYPPEMARILMWEQVRKYMNRLGKKDPIHIEVAKMADYMRRWDKKERELAGVDDKPNTIV